MGLRSHYQGKSVLQVVALSGGNTFTFVLWELYGQSTGAQ